MNLRLAIVTAATAILLTSSTRGTIAQQPGSFTIQPASIAELRTWDFQVDQLMRDGNLRLRKLDDKKMSVGLLSGTYYSTDELRPPTLITFDMKSDLNRVLRFLNGTGSAVERAVTQAWDAVGVR